MIDLTANLTPFWDNALNSLTAGGRFALWMLTAGMWLQWWPTMRDVLARRKPWRAEPLKTLITGAATSGSIISMGTIWRDIAVPVGTAVRVIPAAIGIVLFVGVVLSAIYYDASKHGVKAGRVAMFGGFGITIASAGLAALVFFAGGRG